MGTPFSVEAFNTLVWPNVVFHDLSGVVDARHLSESGVAHRDLGEAAAAVADADRGSRRLAGWPHQAKAAISGIVNDPEH
jgi:hypothetical protein